MIPRSQPRYKVHAGIRAELISGDVAVLAEDHSINAADDDTGLASVLSIGPLLIGSVYLIEATILTSRAWSAGDSATSTVYYAFSGIPYAPGTTSAHITTQPPDAAQPGTYPASLYTGSAIETRNPNLSGATRVDIQFTIGVGTTSGLDTGFMLSLDARTPETGGLENISQETTFMRATYLGPVIYPS